MALVDRPRLARLAERVEDTVGVALRPTSRVRLLEQREEEFTVLAAEASELAMHSMDYFSGRPQELRPERRKRLAQRSRIAFTEDPLAGAEAMLLANFSFGKGVSPPTARDEDVQRVIDRAWSDPVNVETLCGFAAQRKLSNELVTTANLFITYYESGGRIRCGRLNPDLVRDIVPDPDARWRPLWYLAEMQRFEWDYKQDSPKLSSTITGASGGSTPNTVTGARVLYFPHWRNVEDAERERADFPMDTDGEWDTPPDDKLGKGRIYHVAINQLGEQQFGTPPWARTLRFYSAMNVLTESHVAMAQGAASIIATRTLKGTPNQVVKSAGNVLAATGELGASHREPMAPGVGDAQRFAPAGSSRPPAPGSHWVQNEVDRLEAANLNSGASQAAQSAQIVRAPISAASQFGQHYLGSMMDGSLATAATLELPTLMNVQSWQQPFQDLYEWFTDRAIEAAVRAGLLGGNIRPEDGNPLGELRLDEADDRAELETRTGKDLGYEFQMPYPGRRNLADVSSAVSTLLTDYDPDGLNIPLRRMALRYLLTHGFELPDPAAAVNDAIPEDAEPAAPTDKGAGGGGPRDTQPDDAKSQYGEKRRGTADKPQQGDQLGTALEQEWIPPELRQALTRLSADTSELFRDLALDPAVVAGFALTPPANPAANGAPTPAS